MRNLVEFENKYKNEINAIAKGERVEKNDARQMLIYACRQVEKGLHTVGAVMDFGRHLQKEFDFIACLRDFRDAIGETEIAAA